MAQSSLYKNTSTALAEDVNLVSDDTRQLGIVDSVGKITDPVDFTEDSSRNVGQVTVTNTVDTDETGPVGLDIPTGAVFDTGGNSGVSNALTVVLGEYRKSVDFWYNVANTNGDVVVEVSESSGGTNWYEMVRFSGADVITGGKMIQIETAFEYVRAYVTSGIADGNVTRLVLAGKGL